LPQVNLSTVLAYRDGVGANYLHGFVWYKMLAVGASSPQSAGADGGVLDGVVPRVAQTLCCDGCRGGGCNARCASEVEGDWYHACFHGVGHGSILRALMAHGAMGAAYEACTPTPWFRSAPDPTSLAEGEAGCDAAVVGRRTNRKFCMLGVYMSYFENLRLQPAEWSQACETAACPAACIIKCRQFASMLFDPTLFLHTTTDWPSPLVCYGRHPLSRDDAIALDTRFAVYSDPLTVVDAASHRPRVLRSIYEPGHGAVYTPETETWLFETIDTNGNATTGAPSSRRACFSAG
jgi:hypothetical protein